ncbi:hypothetical protein [Desulfoplanes sp.]
MTFGPYAESNFFYIEKSDLYKNCGENVKVAEFLLFRKIKKTSVVWIVEAKSSSPRPENELEFHQYILKLKDKLLNAFTLTIAERLNRHGDHTAELPKELLEMELSAFDCRFILVINGHKLEWLAPLQEALSREFMATAKTWAFSPGCVVVLNKEMAVQHHLVLEKSATG